MNRIRARKSLGSSRKKYQTTTQKMGLTKYSIAKNKEYSGKTPKVSHGTLVGGRGASSRIIMNGSRLAPSATLEVPSHEGTRRTHAFIFEELVVLIGACLEEGSTD